MTTAKNSALPTAYKLLPAADIAAEVAAFTEEMPDVVCFTHIRWDFVYQRPQHLMKRFAQHSRLFVVEEPVYSSEKMPRLQVNHPADNVHVLVPHLPKKLSEAKQAEAQRQLLDQFFIEYSLTNYLFWYYTPAMLEYSAQFSPVLTVYDCMDELAALPFASAKMKKLEKQLLQKADLVFTGGQSLCDAKQSSHPHVFAFPASIDMAHFAQARTIIEEPADQSNIPLIRMGFYGIIDERLDLDLLRSVCETRPEWHIVMLGPVVNIDPETLPDLPNLHFLGKKEYADLPAYLSGWDVALLPFAVNEFTQHISPAKTPEYLAAGRPVVSTPLKDVVKPFGDMGLVQIADGPTEFIAAIEKALEQNQDMVWQQKTDRFLKEMSWDLTWKNMVALMQRSLTGNL